MKAIKITLLVVIGSFVASCESSTYKEISGAKVAAPTYEANIKAIMTANCTSCHSDGGTQQSPYLDTYDAVKLASVTPGGINGNGTVLCRIDESCGSVMPSAGRMPQATIDLINLWATNNYPQN